jgi:predicted RNA-binding protein YlxR (DUF448 family)
MTRGRRTLPRVAGARRTEPIRTCVGCRRRDRRATLTRVAVRNGVLAIDPAKRAPGRGAYLHDARACLEAFARRGGFVRSLRCVIAKDQREALVARLPEVQG